VQSLADVARDPEGQAFALGTTGVSLFLRGRWSQALDKQDVAYAKYSVNKAGWHANGQLFAIWSLTFLGRIDEFRQRHTRLLLDAEDHGDLYTTVNLRIGYSNFAWLVTDDVEAARREVINAMSAWSHRGYHLQHYRAMLAEANIEVYAGAGARAYERVVRDWAKLKKSFLLRVQYVRADAHFVRARPALASSLEGATPRARIAEAQRLAKQLASEDMAWTEPLANMVRAGVASLNDTPEDAARLLTVALRGAEAAEMATHAAAIRRQLGVLIGGDEGSALTAQADHAMTLQGVRVPERLAAMLAPGRWRG
jgi:hypothetical protein